MGTAIAPIATRIGIEVGRAAATGLMVMASVIIAERISAWRKNRKEMRLERMRAELEAANAKTATTT